MTLTFGNTSNLGGSIKAMCYSPAGYGKTVLCATAPAPLIISAENGLLSIKDANIPFIEIKSLADFREAFTFVEQSADAKSFQTICIDSITDIAESALVELKATVKDPRQAYGQLGDEMLHELRRWRHLKEKNVYITCKQDRQVDSVTGITQFVPTMPGKMLPQQLPYWGDELFALRIIVDDQGKKQRWLQTEPDVNYYAKDRSGKLEPFETPNLNSIFSKINGV